MFHNRGSELDICFFGFFLIRVVLSANNSRIHDGGDALETHRVRLYYALIFLKRVLCMRFAPQIHNKNLS